MAGTAAATAGTPVVRAAGAESLGRGSSDRVSTAAVPPMGMAITTSAVAAMPPAPAGSGAARAEQPADQQALETESRQQQAERTAAAAHPVAERLAVGAVAQVTPQDLAPRHRCADLRELRAYLRARDVACSAARGEGGPGLEHERLHLLAPAAQDRGDLVVGQAAELREDECRALALRQSLDVAENPAQVLPGSDVAVEAVRHGLGRLDLGASAPGTEDREAAPPRDAEEPRPEGVGLAAAREVPVGGEERLLQRVVRLVGRADHRPAEGEQRTVMALESTSKARSEPSRTCAARRPSDASPSRTGLAATPADPRSRRIVRTSVRRAPTRQPDAAVQPQACVRTLSTDRWTTRRFAGCWRSDAGSQPRG